MTGEPGGRFNETGLHRVDTVLHLVCRACGESFDEIATAFAHANKSECMEGFEPLPECRV